MTPVFVLFLDRKCLGSRAVENVFVGATIGRPLILLKQNQSPQGERQVIFLRKIRKTTFFGGRAMLAPTRGQENKVLGQALFARFHSALSTAP